MATDGFNRDVLRRIEEDDPALTHLWIGTGTVPDDDVDQVPFSLGHSNDAQVDRLGDLIAENDELEDLFVDAADGAAEMIARSTAFLRGIKNNTSLSGLSMKNCNVDTALCLQLLNSIDRGIKDLLFLTFTDSDLDNPVLATFLPRYTDLVYLDVAFNDADDDVAANIISSLRGLRKLDKLNLTGNYVGHEACAALARLLRDPECVVQYLSLDNNVVDDEDVILLATALKESNNKTLKEFDLGWNRNIVGRGWEALENLLCNTTSINATYLSNHTLQVRAEDGSAPMMLQLYSELNAAENNAQKTMAKILRNHTNFDMQQLFEFELRALPSVIDWFDGARAIGDDTEVKADRGKLTCIYQFVRQEPMMFVPSPPKAGAKRKRSNVGSAGSDEPERTK